MTAGPITVYCGFDPTAPSLHFGNLVQLIVLRHLQRAGHRVICLVGGSTGLIGDPRPTAERVLKTKEQTADWVARIQLQVRPFLDFDGDNPAIVVNNLDWTAPISALDFLRDIGRHFRVNTMIRKDAVAARLSSAEGISYTEFSYQILQALDYLHLFRAYGCTLQTGGQDQWGNLTAGVDLIHRAEGAAVHLLATPLITDSQGNKFGKSEGNAVWLSAEMTSPYAFYQYWFNVEDVTVGQLLRVFTDRSEDGHRLARGGYGRPAAGARGAADAGRATSPRWSTAPRASRGGGRRQRGPVRSGRSRRDRRADAACGADRGRPDAARAGRQRRPAAGRQRAREVTVRGATHGGRGRGQCEQPADHRRRTHLRRGGRAARSVPGATPGTPRGGRGRRGRLTAECGRGHRASRLDRFTKAGREGGPDLHLLPGRNALTSRFAVTVICP